MTDISFTWNLPTYEYFRQNRLEQEYFTHLRHAQTQAGFRFDVRSVVASVTGKVTIAYKDYGVSHTYTYEQMTEHETKTAYIDTLKNRYTAMQEALRERMGIEVTAYYDFDAFKAKSYVVPGENYYTGWVRNIGGVSA